MYYLTCYGYQSRPLYRAGRKISVSTTTAAATIATGTTATSFAFFSPFREGKRRAIFRFY